MRRLRAGLTYVNVVATLALFLALGGGAVWAANKITSKQIGKGAVKNKNLAKNAVKAKNLAKNSVTSAKTRQERGQERESRRRGGQLREIGGRDERGRQLRGGPLSGQPGRAGGIQPAAERDSVAGQPLTVSVEARATFANEGGLPCVVVPFPVVNGNPMLFGELSALVSPGGISQFPNGITVSENSFPVGLTAPGVPQTISLYVINQGNCTPASTVQVSVVVTQAK